MPMRWRFRGVSCPSSPSNDLSPCEADASLLGMFDAVVGPAGGISVCNIPERAEPPMIGGSCTAPRAEFGAGSSRAAVCGVKAVVSVGGSATGNRGVFTAGGG